MLDADESLSQCMFMNVKGLLSNITSDLVWLPRASDFSNDPNQNFNRSDYLGRIVKTSSGLRWHKKLHKLIKADEDTNQLNLSPHLDFAIIHTKPITQVIIISNTWQIIPRKRTKI